MKRAWSTATWTLVVLALSSTVYAHHSAVMFDGSRTVSIQGTVQSYQWTNPHVWIWVQVSNGQGGTDLWGIEAANLSMARRLGMDRNSFKPGDQVKMNVNPLKDGRAGGRFRRATFSDGRVIDVSPPGG